MSGPTTGLQVIHPSDDLKITVRETDRLSSTFKVDSKVLRLVQYFTCSLCEIEKHLKLDEEWMVTLREDGLKAMEIWGFFFHDFLP